MRQYRGRDVGGCYEDFRSGHPRLTALVFVAAGTFC